MNLDISGKGILPIGWALRQCFIGGAERKGEVEDLKESCGPT